METVTRACGLLKAFRLEGEALSLTEIVTRTGLNQTVAFRLLHTLVENGFLRKAGKRRYLSNCRLTGHARFKIGYAAQAEDSPFSAAVTESMRRAASRDQLDLIVLNNRYSASAALRNAERLIAERVDLALEFQTYERVAPVIASLFHEAGIPLIAIEIPHPGATFYGVNNYRVGLSAGRTLGRWAKQHWGGAVEQVLLIELAAAGALPHLRLAGAEAGIRETLPNVPANAFVSLDGKGEFGASLDLVRKHLRRAAPSRTLITGINDPSILGALHAFEEAGRSALCAGLGLGAIAEARAELRNPHTRLIGSIAFFPERYGDELIRLALDILNKKPVPPAVYARHQLVTAANLRQFYPNEADAPACAGQRVPLH